MTSDTTEKPAPSPGPEPATAPQQKPVDPGAQEEAGEVREKSGGYD